MLELIRIGGFNMWFLLVIGAVMVITAIKFAVRADPQRLAILRALTFAILACAITGFCTGLLRSLLTGGEAPGPADERWMMMAIGLGESCANLVLGGMFAVITWILIAVGVRRMPTDPLSDSLR